MNFIIIAPQIQKADNTFRVIGRLPELDEPLEIGLAIGIDHDTTVNEIAITTSPTGRTMFKTDQTASQWQIMLPSYLEISTKLSNVTITKTDNNNVVVVDLEKVEQRFVVLRAANDCLYVIDKTDMKYYRMTDEEYDIFLNRVPDGEELSKLPVPIWNRDFGKYLWCEKDFVPLVEQSEIVDETAETDAEPATTEQN